KRRAAFLKLPLCRFVVAPKGIHLMFLFAVRNCLDCLPLCLSLTQFVDRGVWPLLQFIEQLQKLGVSPLQNPAFIWRFRWWQWLSGKGIRPRFRDGLLVAGCLLQKIPASSVGFRDYPEKSLPRTGHSIRLFAAFSGRPLSHRPPQNAERCHGLS